MPCATERIRVIGDSCTLTDVTKCGDNVEEDGIEVEAWGWD